uniref:Uncharacterized protein n=1 Tax=Bicosoecida sp. CB-2014 TaxID=1486930 RepID=A0A7S1C287_9STRA
MSTEAGARPRHYSQRAANKQASRRQASDAFSRSLLALTSGYFLLDLIALQTPEKSPLDVGQSICLLMSMTVFYITQPIDTKEKYSVVQLVLVLIAGSTALDFVDAAFNIDPDSLLSIVPPVADIVISIIYMVWMAVVLRRSDKLFASTATTEPVGEADAKSADEMASLAQEV